MCLIKALPFYFFQRIIGKITSTSGVLLDKATENPECCLHSSISTLEAGVAHRWPIVGKNGRCSGGIKKTFQEWVDYTVSKYYSRNDRNTNDGLCVDGWRYEVRGSWKICIKHE